MKSKLDLTGLPVELLKQISKENGGLYQTRAPRRVGRPVGSKTTHKKVTVEKNVRAIKTEHVNNIDVILTLIRERRAKLGMSRWRTILGKKQ